MVLKNLPNFIGNIEQINDILKGIEPELERLKTKLNDYLKEIYANSTEEEIRRWELDFNIPLQTSLTLDERRTQILTKLNIKQTLTPENLHNLVRNNIGNETFRVEFNHSNYEFTVFINPESKTEVLNTKLEISKPAHLAHIIAMLLDADKIEIKERQYFIAKYKRYCGTFSTGSNPL